MFGVLKKKKMQKFLTNAKKIITLRNKKKKKVNRVSKAILSVFFGTKLNKNLPPPPLNLKAKKKKP